MSPLDGLESQCHGQVCLAHAGRAQEQDVAGFGYEGQVGQLLDLALVDGGLEAKVKLFQGALEGQVRHSGLGGEVAFPAGGHLSAQQLCQHVGVGQLLVGRGVQGVVQDLDGLLEAQDLQVLAGLFQGDRRHSTPLAAANS